MRGADMVMGRGPGTKLCPEPGVGLGGLNKPTLIQRAQI